MTSTLKGKKRLSIPGRSKKSASLSDKVKISTYSNKDTRYGFMIQDSDEYNTKIYPFGMKEKCRFNGPFYGSSDKIIPQAVGCVGERYENCLELRKYDKEFAGCEFSLYGFDDIGKMEQTEKFIPRKLNNNTFIDKIRLSKIKYPNLMIDRSPDISGTGTRRLGSGLLGMPMEKSQRIEYIDDKIEYMDGTTDTWISSPNISWILFVVLCLLFICIPYYVY